jgi:hypothetical protein
VHLIAMSGAVENALLVETQREEDQARDGDRVALLSFHDRLGETDALPGESSKRRRLGPLQHG